MLLLDTHTLLWWLDADPKLSPAAREAIGQAAVPILVSAVTAFEIATKHVIGKFAGVEQLIAFFDQRLSAEGFTPLPLTIAHALAVDRLPLLHRDPFDRLLVAQAIVEQVTIVSNEKLFDDYGVARLW